jgi:hypothetical protein
MKVREDSSLSESGLKTLGLWKGLDDYTGSWFPWKKVQSGYMIKGGNQFTVGSLIN